MRKFILGLVSLFLLAACENVEIKDGRIPEQYVHMVTPYQGVYQGRFEGKDGTLWFTLVEGNRAVLQFYEGDILNESCGSSIGNLTRATIDKNTLVSAKFDFNPGSCAESILGRSLELSFSAKGSGTRLQVSLMKGYRSERRCHLEVLPGGGSREVCNWEQIPEYLEGNFYKGVNE